MRVLFLSLVGGLFLLGASGVSAGPKEFKKDVKKDSAVYQIVKATDSRVWRLNKHTGEMSVCSLEDVRLVCTSSVNATEVPKQSYAERQAAKQRRLDGNKIRREEQRKKDLAFLDRVIDAVRSLISASALREEES